MPKLIIQEGYRAAGEFIIPEGKSSIGRNLENALCLERDDGVSRVHCQLERKGNTVTLEDLSSRNGTFVNSMPIHVPIDLKHQDTIQIGNVLLIYYA
ncbi:MAG: FHA domain-containing protein, partial [Oligosphaeraceae bacterium]|nr:FHA domain-containing protein [Oligosphaeraceae bacterium]